MAQTIPSSVQTHVGHEQLAEFCRRWHVTELALFGSVLRDDFRTDSDVDVLVSFAPDAQIDLFDFVQMQDELRGLFGRDVDLVDKDSLRNPFRRHAILNSYQVIYAAGGA
jgi:predicted nucleotidyltransferase